MRLSRLRMVRFQTLCNTMLSSLILFTYEKKKKEQKVLLSHSFFVATSGLLFDKIGQSLE